MSIEGAKASAGKVEWPLLLWKAAEEVVRVRMFGQSKYGLRGACTCSGDTGMFPYPAGLYGYEVSQETLLDHANDCQLRVITPQPDNWKLVPNFEYQYWGAACRHAIKYFIKGERVDAESGRHHLACMATSVMFMLEKDLEDRGLVDG